MSAVRVQAAMAHPDRVEILRTKGNYWFISRGGRMVSRQIFDTLDEAKAWGEDAFELCEWRRLAPGHYIAIG